jgi:tetratricopeptide (TPR) repeat protein
MKRRLRFALPAALLVALCSPSLAQNDVLKPFRPGDPAPDEPPKAIPLKPFRTGAKPDAPKENPDDANIPKAVPVKKPTPAGDSPAVPHLPPVATPRPPKTTATEGIRQPTAEMPEPGDIVVGRSAPTTADQVQLQYADGFYAKKLFRDAAAEYERYLDQFTKAPALDRQAVYYRLGECYRLTGAVNNAKANYEALLANFTGGEFLGYAAYRLASMQYEEKNYRDALQSYRRASVRLTQPVLIYSSRFFVGRCLEATLQKAEARQQYEDLAKVVENNPFRDASRLSTGRMYAEAGLRDQALKWLLPLAAETTNGQIKAEALARSGLLQVELGRPDEASKTFDAALALPEVAAWRDTIAVAGFRILYDKKDYKGVLERYQAGGAGNALKIESKLNVLVTVADSQRELGLRDEALATYAQIAQDFPATPQAREAAYARLVMLYDAGDERLLNEVNAFLTDNPTAPQVDRVSLMKAEALFKAGDFEHAAPIYQIVVGRTKSLPGAYKAEATFKLGWCWMQLGQFEEAVKTFTVFLNDFSMNAKAPVALAQRGSAQMQLRQYAAAEKDFAALVAKYPKAKEREFGLENLALIYGQLGDSAHMADTFEVLLKEFPKSAASAKANYWVGRTAFEAKNYKKAAPHLDAARTLDKDQFFERSSLALMASLYNLEDVDATEKEIEFYKAHGGKAETPSDVIRWLGQKCFARGDYARTEKFLPELVLRKAAVGDDYLLLARSRAKLGKFKDAVTSFDDYLAMTKDPVPRVAGMIEKADAQIALKDWDAADKTIRDGLNLATEGRYNGELRLRAGEVEFGRGDMKKALQTFEAIPVTLDDEEVSPRALERALEIHTKLGDTADMKRIENQLRSKYPEYLQKKKLATKP